MLTFSLFILLSLSVLFILFILTSSKIADFWMSMRWALIPADGAKK